ncbi:MAG TPA: emopamil-binding family protein [Streptosporangiaceae bacterium]
MTVLAAAPPRSPVPLRRRRLDWILLAFFAVNLGFITYFVDIEQLTVANAHHFQYPLWPPKGIVNLVHSYGSKYDPLLIARPAFWKMTIWIDVIWNGPFYVAAIYALIRGRDWLRMPALVWSGSMSAVVLIILAEEHSGVYRTPHFGIVLLLNLPWLALPAATILRMRREHPFTEPAIVRLAGHDGGQGAAAPSWPPAGRPRAGGGPDPAGGLGADPVST